MPSTSVWSAEVPGRTSNASLPSPSPPPSFILLLFLLQRLEFNRSVRVFFPLSSAFSFGNSAVTLEPSTRRVHCFPLVILPHTPEAELASPNGFWRDLAFLFEFEETDRETLLFRGGTEL